MRRAVVNIGAIKTNYRRNGHVCDDLLDSCSPGQPVSLFRSAFLEKRHNVLLHFGMFSPTIKSCHIMDMMTSYLYIWNSSPKLLKILPVLLILIYFCVQFQVIFLFAFNCFGKNNVEARAFVLQ